MSEKTFMCEHCGKLDDAVPMAYFMLNDKEAKEWELQFGHTFGQEWNKKMKMMCLNCRTEFLNKREWGVKSTMDKVKGFASLSDEQKQLFERAYSRHMAYMGTEKRMNFSIDHLKEVRWDASERCLKVYFQNGDWWHYDTKGDWY